MITILSKTMFTSCYMYLHSGLPQHQNGMYGLHHSFHHFQSFDPVQSLPLILNKTGDIWYGIIGKKHVGPEYVYPFPFAYTEENYNLDQVGRNITFMKELVYKFLTEAKEKDKQFLLYIGFFDVHRCGNIAKYGQFCEKFGDGTPGMGTIPDWHPVDYSPDDVYVPYFIQNTTAAKEDLAAQYRAVSRMDQGIGLFMQALKDFGYENDTIVIYTADNGIPFPNAKTNLYDPGMAEPMMISNPLARQRWGQETEAMASLTDIVPTILDWFGIPYPKYTIFGHNPVTLQGHSMLPLTEEEPASGWDTVFSSHNLHEVSMYYPTRVLRNKQYKLIHNVNYKMPYPIATDIYSSLTFQDLLHNTINGTATNWFKTLNQYYYRDPWELYDLEQDPHEMKNLASVPQYKDTFTKLASALHEWQNATDDPWLCAPNGVLENGSNGQPVCLTLDNNV